MREKHPADSTRLEPGIQKERATVLQFGAFVLGIALGVPIGYLLSAYNCLERWLGIDVIVE